MVSSSLVSFFAKNAASTYLIRHHALVGGSSKADIVSVRSMTLIMDEAAKCQSYRPPIASTNSSVEGLTRDGVEINKKCRHLASNKTSIASPKRSTPSRIVADTTITTVLKLPTYTLAT